MRENPACAYNTASLSTSCHRGDFAGNTGDILKTKKEPAMQVLSVFYVIPARLAIFALSTGAYKANEVKMPDYFHLYS